MSGWGTAFKEAPVAKAARASLVPTTFPTEPVDWDRLVTLDFETFYDVDYTLSKLSTSEYIRDPRFKAQMVGIKIGNRKTKVVPASRVKTELKKISWATHSVLCHNAQFDAFILSHHYGIHPKKIYCTLSMARGLHSNEIGAGLDEVSKFYGGQGKIEGGLEPTKGVLNWPPALVKSAGIYCANDVDECFRVFKLMVPQMPRDEVDLIDLTIKMFTDPVLQVDIARVETELAREKKHRKDLMLSIAKLIKQDDPELIKTLTKAERELTGEERTLLLVKKCIGSNERFANLLRTQGVEPPTKISPAWMKKSTAERALLPPDAKYAYAFAKDDQDFVTLPDDDERWSTGLDRNKKASVMELAVRGARIRALVETRLAVKSTTNITRAERFLKAGADGMPLPCGYAYFRAHTGRWGGNNKMNMQNLTRGGELRLSILAPKGHQIAVADSGQIEARVNGWLWGQDDLLAAFAASDQGVGRDAYCLMADVIYGRTITKADSVERFVGKTCLAADTLVYTNHGLKPIIEVRSNDLLWDGAQWVQHDGLMPQGKKKVHRIHGLAATPDHEVLTEHGWREWRAVHTNPSLFRSALCSAKLSSSATNTTPHPRANFGATAQYADALAAMRRRSTSAVSKLVAPLAAILAQRSLPAPNAIGNTKTQWQMMSTGLGYSTVFHLPSAAAKTNATLHTDTMADVASVSALSGSATEPLSFVTCKHVLAGMSQLWRWIDATMTATTSPATSASSTALQMRATAATWVISKLKFNVFEQRTQTYDLVNAGPNHRFMVETDFGPVIVHNCVLGLGFQMGAAKFQMTLAKGTNGPPVFFTLKQCEEIVNKYRRKNHRIEQGWRTCKRIIEEMAAGISGSHKCLTWGKDHITLPNGMTLKYPDLKKAFNQEKGYEEWTYQSGPNRKKIYGGLLCENIVQALARIIVGYQMLTISRKHRVVMTTHDEVVACIKRAQASSAFIFMIKTMRTPLAWCPDLPLNAEGGCADNYSK